MYRGTQVTLHKDFTVRVVKPLNRMPRETGMSTPEHIHTWTRQSAKQPDLTLKLCFEWIKDEVISSDSF